MYFVLQIVQFILHKEDSLQLFSTVYSRIFVCFLTSSLTKRNPNPKKTVHCCGCEVQHGEMKKKQKSSHKSQKLS